MNVCHVFNTANDLWYVCKALRKYTKIKADLVVSTRDFIMRLPIWEEYDVDVEDAYACKWDDLIQRYKMPEWVKVWHPRETVTGIIASAELFKLSRGYDLLVLSPPAPIYLQFQSTPYLIHESGWLRKLVTKSTHAEKLARRGYGKAKAYIMTNPDMYDPVKFPVSTFMPPRRRVFIPFVIDTEKYKPAGRSRNNEELVFLHPTRQEWIIKGNDRLIKAFALYLKRGGKGRLIMMDWGWQEHVDNAKRLVKALGIEKKVEWIKPVSKPKLVRLYQEADVVFDQFVLGSYGTTAPEAMACGKPVVMYVNQYWHGYCYGITPPIYNARTTEEILESMVYFSSLRERERVGVLGRKYVELAHNPFIIANLYDLLYSFALVRDNPALYVPQTYRQVLDNARLVRMAMELLRRERFAQAFSVLRGEKEAR